MTLTRKQLHATMRAAGVRCDIMLPDRAYRIPTKKWFRKSFVVDLEYLQVTLDYLDWEYKWIYRPESGDCDNAAVSGLCCAQWCNSKSTGRTSIPVAEIHYTQTKRNVQIQHAINLCVCGRNKDILFMEPQTRRIITLKKYEIKSIVYCRFA